MEKEKMFQIEYREDNKRMIETMNSRELVEFYQHVRESDIVIIKVKRI